MQRVGIIAQHVAARAPIPTYDIIIRNGTVFDGLRTPRFVSDIGIRDGKVATIGRISKEAGCRKEIDATGLNVCPGFVDLHTHYDAQLFWDPYLTMGGWHGVTSVVIGNCGFGYAPCKKDFQKRTMQSLERNEAIPYEAQAAGMPWDWESFPEYLDSIDRAPKGVNIMSFVGLNPVMIYVMGLEAARKRPSTPEEMVEMKKILREAMEAGAAGFSAQILGQNSVQRDYDGEPMVTDTMSKEDLYAFGSVLSDLDQGFIQVAGPTFKTTENLARASGRPILYNAVLVQTDNKGNPQDQHNVILRWLTRANKEQGLRIFGQALTQDVGLTFSFKDFNLFDSSPAWRNITLGTKEERAKKMQHPHCRMELKDEFDAGRGPLSDALDDGTGLETEDGDGGISQDNGNAVRGDMLTLVSAQKDNLRKYENMNCFQIAKERGQHVVDAILDITLEDDMNTEWTTTQRDLPAAEVKKVAVDEYTVLGLSDGGAHTKYLTLGEYPTHILTNLVRTHEMMSLEDAHWKLSKYPAQASGMTDRGYIAEGMPADILVYDFKNLHSMPTEVLFDLPGGEWRRVKHAEGYQWIIVNGEITFEGQRCTGATPGKLLRHGHA